MSMVKHRNRLTRELVKSLSLEVLKTQQGKALNNLVYLRGQACLVQGVRLDDLWRSLPA